MRKFDEYLKARLTKLDKARALLHFPFFANTFPLAFHYAALVGAEAKARIFDHDWEKPIPSLRDGELNVFYATKKAAEDCGEDIVYRVVSQYRPRLIFAEYRPFLYAEVKPERDERILDLDKEDGTGADRRNRKQMFPDAFLAIAKDLKVDSLELFTDIPDQARLIKAKTDPPLTTEVIAEGVDGLKSADAAKRVLRLFFFGAPASTRMMRDPLRYIPFLIEDGILESDNTMLTCICVADKRSPVGEEDEVLAILGDLEEYHRSIFLTAQEAKGSKQKDGAMDFHDVWLAYNRMAERKQHSTVFTSPDEFAACLRTHHRNPDAATAK